MEEIVKNNRGGVNPFIDSVKGSLIFLVVLGHVVFQSETVYTSRWISAIISWIWFFHMPAFVFISGYLTNTKKVISKQLVSCGHILFTYILMQTVLTVVYGPHDLFNYLLIPQYAMWYLPALVVWRLLGVKIITLIKNDYFLLLLSILISIGSGFVPIKVLGFQRICAFFPFFISGMILRKHGIKLDKFSKYRYLSIAFLLLMFVSFMVFNRTICSGMCNIPYKNIFQLFTRFSVLIIGSIMSFAWISVTPTIKWLSYIGRKSLFVYCYHVFFIVGILPNIWVKTGINTNEILIILYATVSFVLLVILSKSALLNKILSPFK